MWNTLFKLVEKDKINMFDMEAQYQKEINKNKNDNSIEGILEYGDTVSRYHIVSAMLNNNNLKRQVNAFSETNTFNDRESENAIAGADVLNTHENAEANRLNETQEEIALGGFALGIMAGGVGLMNHALSNTSNLLSMPLLGIGALAAVSIAGYCVATRLSESANNSKGYESLVNNMQSNTFSGVDLNKEALSYFRNGSWIVHHPNKEKPYILNHENYYKYRTKMHATDTPMIEIKASSFNVYARRYVGGLLQSSPDIPAVLKFDRSGNDKSQEKHLWYEKGERKDAKFFRTMNFVDTPFMKATRRLSDGQISIDTLAPGNDGLKRINKTYTKKEADNIIELLKNSHGDMERESILAKHLGIPEPSEWLGDYNPSTGEASIKHGDTNISITRDNDLSNSTNVNHWTVRVSDEGNNRF